MEPDAMIEEFAAIHKLPAFRTKQFNLAFYREHISSYDELSTWPKNLREELKTAIPFSTIAPLREIHSDDNETSKVLFSRTSDGKLFESVLMMHEDERNTVCVSCMIGCPVGCSFCATGKMKFVGNLTAREIVDQVLYFARLLRKKGESVTNIVFMGMGEPLLNLDEVLEAIRILNDPDRCGFGIRRITISTSGITPKIYELMKKGYKGRLALSLHAPDQKLREKLMPIAKAYHLRELLPAVKSYALRTQLRVTYEYILIQGVNDSPLQADMLANLVGPELTHINLIPYNPVAGVDMKRPSNNTVHQFASILQKHGVSSTFRVTMGDDIKAACGQLAT